MPRRFSTETRAWIYRYLCLRDGEKCAECGITPAEIKLLNNKPMTRNGLEIDHIDNNHNNNGESNFQLLCPTCNTIKENTHRRGRPKAPKCPCVCVRAETDIMKDALPYAEASPEMRANAQYETSFRTWLLEYIRNNGYVGKVDAVNAGAEICGCNPSTSGRYLAKLTSLAGPLRESKDRTGAIVISYKAEYEASL
jgi:hypothetical protein